jgi:3-isopropylmalate/(R)-2-methylmalate dehydratase small subunit
MKAFVTHEGVVVPLDRANIDTDAIIPKQFLKSIFRSGFGPNLFDEWRYLDPWDENDTDRIRRPNPQFVLNQPAYAGATILLARENFGCGSSREHAPWALADFGIRVIVAPSFADIFFSNAFKNGILAVKLAADQVDSLFVLAVEKSECLLRIDLPDQQVVTPEGVCFEFAIDPFHKHCLVNGLDEIELTLADAKLIRDYEDQRRQHRPWLFNSTILSNSATGTGK